MSITSGTSQAHGVRIPARKPTLPAEAMAADEAPVLADVPSTQDARLPGDGVQRTVSLPVDRRAQRRAVEFAEAVCADWKLATLTDDVAIAVAELAQNAIRHATLAPIDPRGLAAARALAVVLSCWPRAGMLIALVRDRDPRPPVRRPCPDPTAIDLADPAQLAALTESGRGLHTIESVCADFGWYPIPPIGKAVWCSFRFRPADQGDGER